MQVCNTSEPFLLLAYMVVNFFTLTTISIFNPCHLRELRRYPDMGLEYSKNPTTHEKWADKLTTMIKLVNHLTHILLHLSLKVKSKKHIAIA